jgi:hypothetical protein
MSGSNRAPGEFPVISVHFSDSAPGADVPIVRLDRIAESYWGTIVRDGQFEDRARKTVFRDDITKLPTTAQDNRTAAAVKGSDCSERALLFPLEHVDGEAIGVHLANAVGPKAIDLIALDIFDGHQRPA